MFPVEHFGEKTVQESPKKDLQRLCLISWIATINIDNYNLPLRVLYYKYYY